MKPLFPNSIYWLMITDVCVYTHTRVRTHTNIYNIYVEHTYTIYIIFVPCVYVYTCMYLCTYICILCVFVYLHRWMGEWIGRLIDR